MTKAIHHYQELYIRCKKKKKNERVKYILSIGNYCAVLNKFVLLGCERKKNRQGL